MQEDGRRGRAELASQRQSRVRSTKDGGVRQIFSARKKTGSFAKFDPADISEPDPNYMASLKRQVDLWLTSSVPDEGRDRLFFNEGLLIKSRTAYPADYAERLSKWVRAGYAGDPRREQCLRELDTAIAYMELGIEEGWLRPTEERFRPSSVHRGCTDLHSKLHEMLEPVVARYGTRTKVVGVLTCMLDYQSEADRLGNDRFCMSFNRLTADTGISKPSLSRYLPFVVEDFRRVIDTYTKNIMSCGVPVFKCLMKAGNTRRERLASEYCINPQYRCLLIPDKEQRQTDPETSEHG